MKDEFIQHHGFVTKIDDPDALGRVKVHIPAIDGSNPDQETIWVNILKSPEGLGADHPSPPQVGTSVMIQVSKTNPSLRQVSSVVASRKAKADPSMPGNKSLAREQRKKFEQVQNKNISGRPIYEQKQEQLDRNSNKSKAPVQESQKTYEPTIADRDALQTLIPSLNSMIQKVPPLKNVTTARQPDANAFTAAMAAALPGQVFGLANIFDHIQGDLLKELERNVSPDVMAALKNVAATAAQFTPAQVDGFLQQTNRVNPATFATNMLNELKNVRNGSQLNEALNKIMNDDTVKDLSSMASVALTAASAFGDIAMTMSPDGTVTESTNDAIEQLKSLFGQVFGGITTMGGASKFMDGSIIPDELLKRLPSNLAAANKEFLNKVAGQGNQPREMVEGVMSTLKSRLG
jgi:hypothetical protein